MNGSKKNNKIYIYIAAIIIVAVAEIFFVPPIGAVVAAFVVLFVAVKSRQKEEIIEEPKRVIESRLRLSDLRLPANIPFPYAVFSDTGNILFYNGEFDLAFGNKTVDKNILSVFPDIKFEEGEFNVSLDGRNYIAYVKRSEVIDKNKFSDDILSLFLVDITENSELKGVIERNRLVGAFVFIDNFEEVSENIDETSGPILTALIDRKLNAFATEYGGLIKKYEKDRYIFVTTLAMLEKLKENKFEIINEVKTVSVGSHIPVTLSIGMGVASEETPLDVVLKDAKAAIDLALGRGGDQVVIKTEKGYQFFGDATGETVRNARIRARVKADAYAELVKGSDAVVVMGHKRPDLDCFGAAIGVMCIARSLDVPCYILVDEATSGIAVLYEKLLSTGEYSGIIVKENEALPLIKDTTLLTIVDTHRMGLVESEAAIKKAKRLVIFDHHRKSADYIEGAVLSYHEPYASSTCELVTEMIQYLEGNVKLTNNEADALLAGIIMDTKDFGLKTGAITFEAAAYLRRKGADSTRVRMLMREDIESHRARAEAIKNAFVYRDIVAISVCPGDDEAATITSAQAADELLFASGIKAAFVLCKVKGTVYVSARSFGDINVQLIAEKLGGGGHATISGLQLEEMEIEDALEKIKSVIDEYLEV